MTNEERDAEIAWLKELIEVRIGEQDKRITLLFAEREKQVALALANTEKAAVKAEHQSQAARKEWVRWRDSTSGGLTRFATLAAQDLIRDRLNSLERAQARIAGGLVVVATLVPIASVALAHFIQ